MNTEDFLKIIYNGCDTGFITITMLPKAKTSWFKFQDFEKAATFSENQGKFTNVFFGVGLRKNILKNGLRGGENDISHITTLYADIDIKSDAHAQKCLPENIDEAVNFLNSLILKPSITVNSGNGIHGYWLFNEPYKIIGSESKNLIISLFKAFGKYINQGAKKHGWKIDNISDLARILRLPGTLNHKLKTKTMCEVISHDERRYTISEISKVLKFDCDNSKILQNIENMLQKCAFIKHCQSGAKTLPEPLWHAMITNLAPLNGGEPAIHEFSKPYPKYSKSETDEKIRHALREDKPHTCDYIKNTLNFDCCKECNVKAPIVFGLPSNEERLAELLAAKIDISKIFSKENMKLCLWAKINKPAEYAQLKLNLKGKVNLKDFEKAVRFESHKKMSNIEFKGNQTLNLEGIELGGAVTPKGWNISLKHGVRRIFDEEIGDGTSVQEICPCAVVISKRFENIDSGTQKVEIKFFRDNHWHSIIASRSHVFNRTSIIKLADGGLPVSSGNASDIVKYLSDYENTNLEKIPLIRSVSRMGWVGKEFFPHYTKSKIQFETEYKEANNIIQSTENQGDFEVWKSYASKLRKNIFGRFLLSGSFVSPLLSLLGNRVFFIHIWHDSKSGKTAAIKTAVSVWGNPAKLMGSFNATAVGMERMAAILKHLPFALDELQVLNSRRQTVEHIIYSLGNGIGRLRGAREGAVQETLSWHNIILTSGEQPMSKESSNDGILTRVLELYGKPCEDVNFAHELHIMSINNCGFAGKIFIKYLVENVLNQKNKLKKDFENLRKEIETQSEKSVDNAHIDDISVVCLGDYYSSIAVFEIDEKIAKNEAIMLGTEILKNTKELEKADTIGRAWDFVVGWIASNKNRFLPDSTPCYGKIENDAVYVIPSILRDALEENGFDYGKIIRGFKERGFIETQKDAKNIVRMQVSTRINGIIHKCFLLRGVTFDDLSGGVNPLV
ncbi:MAG: DUF927 domain-containing protein [Oscillospiraceae bacterium]|jgi:uncharacterized protein (DUF927 family)|nr:DUF927 domain-containing protein [Oscillospiraceae bacterium]